MMKISRSTKYRALLCIILCFSIMQLLAACNKDDIPKESEPEIKEIAISKEDRYKINMFLTSFSRQCFPFFSDKFETETADVIDLAYFAWNYAYMNMQETFKVVDYEDDLYHGIDIVTLDAITQRFFDRSIDEADIQTAEEIGSYGYDPIVVNGKMCRPLGVSDHSHDFTITKEMYDLGDGSIQATFNIYDDIILNYFIDSDRAYHFTPSEADAGPDFQCHGSGVAVVRPYTTENGEETYQLVSYEVMYDIGETENESYSETENEIYIECDGELLSMNKEDQYRINIFLSNFSEQGFHLTDKFETETADAMDLAEFAWMHTKINRHEALEVVHCEDDCYFGIDIVTLNAITQRFFDRSIDVADIQTVEKNESTGYDPIVVDGKMCHVMAVGETYNRLTVAKEMYDLGDGTIQVIFSIYRITDKSIVDFTIEDKSVYYFTPSEANAHPNFECEHSGVAVVRPYTTENGKETYQLVSYQVMT